MGFNKDGKYRINIYLNPLDIKDKTIIEYLEGRYSPADYIKETLYTIATGQTVANTGGLVKAEISIDTEVEDIVGLDNIEI